MKNYKIFKRYFKNIINLHIVGKNLRSHICKLYKKFYFEAQFIQVITRLEKSIRIVQDTLLNLSSQEEMRKSDKLGNGRMRQRGKNYTITA